MGTSEAAAASKDPQAKRWRRAQEAFYTNVEAVQRELSDRTPLVLAQLNSYAQKHRLEAPPSLCISQSTPSAASSSHVQEESGSLEGGGFAGSPLMLFLEELKIHEDYQEQICHIESYAPRPPQYVAFRDLVDGDGQQLLSPHAMNALQMEFGIESLFVHQ